jgi:hypothetical protein
MTKSEAFRVAAERALLFRRPMTIWAAGPSGWGWAVTYYAAGDENVRGHYYGRAICDAGTVGRSVTAGRAQFRLAPGCTEPEEA